MEFELILSLWQLHWDWCYPSV